VQLDDAAHERKTDPKTALLTLDRCVTLRARAISSKSRARFAARNHLKLVGVESSKTGTYTIVDCRH
jgi:hypothetical protein